MIAAGEYVRAILNSDPPGKVRTGSSDLSKESSSQSGSSRSDSDVTTYADQLADTVCDAVRIFAFSIPGARCSTGVGGCKAGDTA